MFRLVYAQSFLSIWFDLTLGMHDMSDKTKAASKKLHIESGEHKSAATGSLPECPPPEDSFESFFGVQDTDPVHTHAGDWDDEEHHIRGLSLDELGSFYQTLSMDPDYVRHTKSWPSRDDLIARYDEVADYSDTFHPAMDRDQNGFVEWEELTEARNELKKGEKSPLHRLEMGHFNDADLNEDKSLTKRELFYALLAVHPWDDEGAALVGAMDKNADERIGVHEILDNLEDVYPTAMLTQGHPPIRRVIRHMMLKHDSDDDGKLNEHEIGKFTHEALPILYYWAKAH